MKGIFITATGTDVGKTIIASGIARFLRNCGVNVGVMKPVASGGKGRGGEVSPDAQKLKEAAKSKDKISEINPLCYKNPLAPYLASLVEKKIPDIEKIVEIHHQMNKRHDFIVVEGIGGVRVPLTEKMELSDLISKMGIPAIIVVSSKLGTLNHTLLTLEHLKKKKVKVIGIVLNYFDGSSMTDRTNLEYFRRKKIPIMTVMPSNPKFAKNFNLIASQISMSPLGKWLKRYTG